MSRAAGSPGVGRTPASAPRDDYIVFGKPAIGAAEQRAVAAVLRSGWIGMGPETAAFEQELAAFTGARHAVAVNSCTSALFLSLLVKGIGPGDEVICPSFTWCSSANAAIYLGAKPVFCDIDAATFNVTAETVKARLTPRTRAVVVVHMGGLAADVGEIRRALPPTVAIIEDAAHALGANYPDGRKVGASGNLCCFSFYANKNLSTGEGGAVLLNNRRLAARLVKLRLHGLSADAWKRFSNPSARVRTTVDEIGYKMNFTDLQAALGRVQLARQGEFAKRRLEVARLYAQYVERSLPGAVSQKHVLDEGHSRHLYQILLPPARGGRQRDDIVRRLREQGVGACIHYPPLHKMKPYRKFAPGRLSVTDDVGSRIMTLPIGSALTLREARRVTRALDVTAPGCGAAR